MTVSSLHPARRLADLAAGWEGLWSLLVTARRAALARIHGSASLSGEWLAVSLTAVLVCA
jgi:hypothetical protein